MKNFFTININNSRIYGLDILRCLAILLVIFEHGNFFLPAELSYYIEFLRFDGVSIFFVLSGFLVGGILIKTIELDGSSYRTLLNFWIRRWFRTLPVYFFILFLLIVKALIQIPGFKPHMVWDFFVFSQNLFYRHPDWFFPEAWSISIEEWFYILVPVFIFVMIRLKIFNIKGAIVATAIYIILMVIIFRFYRYSNSQIFDYTDWDSIFRKQVVTRLDSVMFGLIGAYIIHYYMELWYKYKYQLFFIGFLMLLIYSLFFHATYKKEFGLYLCVYSFSINSFAVLLMLPFLSSLKRGHGFIYKSVTYVAIISYSMYLLNLSIILGWIVSPFEFNFFMKYGFILKYLLFWFLTIVLSIVLYKYVELPFMRMRDRKSKP